MQSFFNFNQFLNKIKNKEHIDFDKLYYLLSDNSGCSLVEHCIINNQCQYSIDLVKKLLDDTNFYDYNELFIMACENPNLPVLNFLLCNYNLDIQFIRNKLHIGCFTDLGNPSEYYDINKRNRFIEVYKFLIKNNILIIDQNFDELVSIICCAINSFADLKNLAFWLLEYYNVNIQNNEKIINSIANFGNEQLIVLLIERLGEFEAKKIFNYDFVIKTLYMRSSRVSEWIIQKLLNSKNEYQNLENLKNSILNCIRFYHKELNNKMEIIYRIAGENKKKLELFFVDNLFNIDHLSWYFGDCDEFINNIDITNIDINSIIKNEQANLTILIKLVLDDKINVTLEDFLTIYKRSMVGYNLSKKIFQKVFIINGQNIMFFNYLLENDTKLLFEKIKYDEENLKFVINFGKLNEQLILKLFEYFFKESNYDNLIILIQKYPNYFEENNQLFYSILQSNKYCKNALKFHKLFKNHKIDYNEILKLCIRDENLDEINEIINQIDDFSFDENLFNIASKCNSNQILMFMYNYSPNEKLLSNENFYNACFNNNIPMIKLLIEMARVKNFKIELESDKFNELSQDFMYESNFDEAEELLKKYFFKESN